MLRSGRLRLFKFIAMGMKNLPGATGLAYLAMPISGIFGIIVSGEEEQFYSSWHLAATTPSLRPAAGKVVVPGSGKKCTLSPPP